MRQVSVVIDRNLHRQHHFPPSSIAPLQHLNLLSYPRQRRESYERHGALVTTPFLDITSKVESGGEKGLLGLAFHPSFSSNRRFFLYYTRRLSLQLQSVFSEYAASSSNPNQADAFSERILLVVNQPFDNHNGGQLAFGPVPARRNQESGRKCGLISALTL